jgi:hypothetical protein
MTAATWTVPNIIDKVRNITGTPSDTQLTDDQILTYINNYYVYTMPLEMKQQVQLQYYDFTTLPNVDTYNFSSSFLTQQPICWADGIFVNYYEDPNIFWKDWPQQYSSDPVGTGDGTTTFYSGTVQSMQLIIGTFLITDGVQTAIDDGLGNLKIGSVVVGSITYSTGSWSITFPTAPASGANIYDKYQAMVQTRPQGVLFFNNKLTFRPIPDQVYQIRMQGYILPNTLVNTVDDVNYSPTFNEWGQVIAYGAAMDIFADRGDSDGQAQCYANLKRFENVALARYIQQFESQRPAPKF